jgi:hypothetical protein
MFTGIADTGIYRWYPAEDASPRGHPDMLVMAVYSNITYMFLRGIDSPLRVRGLGRSKSLMRGSMEAIKLTRQA